MDAKVEEQIAEAFAEAEEKSVAVPENTGQPEKPNTEIPTEEAASDAGIFLSVNDETGREAAAEILEGEGSAEDDPAGAAVSAIIEVDEKREEPLLPGRQPEVIGARDWESEWRELAQAHPEVVGKPLPEEVWQACMKSDQPPLRVYEGMMLTKQAEEIQALKQEIATLKQNAEAASRAPVSAVTGGGAGSEPEDPFIKAFWSY